MITLKYQVLEYLTYLQSSIIFFLNVCLIADMYILVLFMICIFAGSRGATVPIILGHYYAQILYLAYTPQISQLAHTHKLCLNSSHLS